MGRVPLAERAPFIILLKLPVGTVNVRGAPAVTVRLILKRAELDLRAISCMQFKRVNWNVRNCPKRSYAGAIANCEIWVASSLCGRGKQSWGFDPGAL